jgi:ATP-binding cassette subfamily F protein 3
MEQQIADLENEVKQLESRLADEDIYNNANKLKETNSTYKQKQSDVKRLQEQWETLAEQIMELEA